jgi:hypothetical protein
MKRQLTSLAAILLLGSLLPAESMSAPTARSEQWEISLIPTYTNAKTLQGGGGSFVNMSAHSGLAIGIGYNFNDYLGMDMVIGSTNGNYSATAINDTGTPVPYSGSYYASYIDLGLTYYFMRSNLTPFVKGNLGYTYVDSGIPTGNTGNTCWWDPWYGYVCGTYSQTYTSNEYNYGADLGLRYEFNDAVFLKGSIGASYVDFQNLSYNYFTIYKLAIGFSFK